MSQRIERINSEIQKCLAEIIRGRLAEYLDGVMISVTAAETTKDLKYCKAFVSIYAKGEQRDKVFIELSKHTGLARRELASMLKTLRTVPEITFVLDTSLDYSQKITQLLDDIKNK